MSTTTNRMPDGVLLLPAGEGRQYSCCPMQSVFLADGDETGNRYSVSIWWVDPGKPGPGAHRIVRPREAITRALDLPLGTPSVT